MALSMPLPKGTVSSRQAWWACSCWGTRGITAWSVHPPYPAPPPHCAPGSHSRPLRHPGELNLPTIRPVRGLIILSELCMELYLLQETRLMTRISRLALGSSVFDGRFLPRLRLPDCSLLSPRSTGVLPKVPSGSCPDRTQPPARRDPGWLPPMPPRFQLPLTCSLPGPHAGAPSLRFRCAV